MDTHHPSALLFVPFNFAACFDGPIPTQLILEGFHTSTAIYSVVALFKGASITDAVVRRWGLAAWALDLTLNILVTGAIAGKIWWQGRQTVSARGHNAYLGVAYTILESGGLFTGATLILFILYINASTGLDALVGVNVVVQLAVSLLSW